MTFKQTSERLRFSVIVVSHRRPWWLRRCLTALRQLDHPAFEVIVVADADGLQELEGDDFKRISFDVPNISQARNIGIAAAAGELCAFVDDDAVPEPLWLHHHEKALRTTGAVAAVGYVRGRNGISFQSCVASIDAEGETHQEVPFGDGPFVPDLQEGRALKLVGTNMVVRKDALIDLGGFDPAYAFYLDDTDISLRLAKKGLKAAVAPLAEVHHAFAPSVRRSGLRVPTYLGDIGRSTAVFMRRHRGISESELFERLHAREKARLIHHMIQGTCEPRDLSGLLEGLVEGWRAGVSMDLPEVAFTQCGDSGDFHRIRPMEGHSVVASRLLRRKKRLAKAEKEAKMGQRISVFSFSLTPVRHLVRYLESGVWVQTGGQFGRADRNDRMFRWCRFANRMKTEIRRVAKQRGI